MPTDSQTLLDVKKTWLPITAVIAIVAALLGGMQWLNVIANNSQRALSISEQNTGRISTLENKNQDIIERTTRIETKIDLLLEQKKN